ncbi:hypothetical protein BKA93DRAFT_751046 [Sparassis latifolia]
MSVQEFEIPQGTEMETILKLGFQPMFGNGVRVVDRDHARYKQDGVVSKRTGWSTDKTTGDRTYVVYFGQESDIFWGRQLVQSDVIQRAKKVSVVNLYKGGSSSAQIFIACMHDPLASESGTSTTISFSKRQSFDETSAPELWRLWHSCLGSRAAATLAVDYYPMQRLWGFWVHIIPLEPCHQQSAPIRNLSSNVRRLTLLEDNGKRRALQRLKVAVSGRASSQINLIKRDPTGASMCSGCTRDQRKFATSTNDEFRAHYKVTVCR